MGYVRFELQPDTKELFITNFTGEAWTTHFNSPYRTLVTLPPGRSLICLCNEVLELPRQSGCPWTMEFTHDKFQMVNLGSTNGRENSITILLAKIEPGYYENVDAGFAEIKFNVRILGHANEVPTCVCRRTATTNHFFNVMYCTK